MAPEFSKSNSEKAFSAASALPSDRYSIKLMILFAMVIYPPNPHGTIRSVAG
jgi:hypothetical protein